MRNTSWRPLILVFSLSGIFFVLFVLGSFIFFSKGLEGKSKTASKALFKKDAVGLIELNGVIMDSKKFLKSLDKLDESPDVKAIVVRVNSPGGAVAPSQEIHDALKRIKKPVVASMSSVAASGGYYVSVAAKKIYANPGTITGSIGVIMEFANLEKLLEWAKVKRFSIKTGKFKDSGAEYREMQPEERALLQGMVDNVLEQFKRAVAEGRGLKLEEVTPLADGRIFSGEQAKAARLVDELGGVDDAILGAAKLAGIEGKPRVHTDEKKKQSGLFRLFEEFNDMDDDAESSKSGIDGMLAKTAARLLGIGADAVVSASRLDPGVYWLWRGASSY